MFSHLSACWRELTSGYADRKVPLAAYAALVGVNLLWTGSLVGCDANRYRRLSNLTAADWLLLGVATHKVSRLVSKDRVTSPFRAPFTRLEKSAGAGEVEEMARGQGMQQALGELVSCPFCMSAWVATALATGWVLAPRATRTFCGLMSAVGLAHFLHHAYMALEERHS